MPLFGTGQSYETAESGTYICDLTKVSLEEGTKFGTDEKQEQFKWSFTVDKELQVDGVDSRDKPYKFTTWTGTVYGNEKANLTKVIRGLEGKPITVEEFEEKDLEEYQTSRSGKKYKVSVIEVETSNGTRNKITAIKPYVPAKKKTPLKPVASVAAADGEGVDFGDPFADGVNDEEDEAAAAGALAGE